MEKQFRPAARFVDINEALELKLKKIQNRGWL